MTTKYKKFRLLSLTLAESFDSWRIIPRLIVMGYALLIANMYIWYKQIPTYVQEECNAAVLEVYISKKNLTTEEAKRLSCTVKDVVGGPTTSQTTFVTVITGLSSLIFAFYTNSGRRWENGLPEDAKDRPTE